MDGTVDHVWALPALAAVKRLRALYCEPIHGITPNNETAVQLAVIGHRSWSPSASFVDVLASVTGVKLAPHAVALVRREYPILIS